MSGLLRFGFTKTPIPKSASLEQPPSPSSPSLATTPNVASRLSARESSVATVTPPSSTPFAPTTSTKKRVVLEDSEEEHEIIYIDAKSSSAAAPHKPSSSSAAPAKKKAQSARASSDESALSLSSSSSEQDSADEEDDDEPPPVKKAKSPTLSTPSAPPASLALSQGEHEHDRLKWLLDPLDAHKRPRGHPQYDPTTLYVPEGYLRGDPRYHDERTCRKITPAMVDWWTFYATLFDCVLAFKVGKFFEMYHRCADVAVRVCGLVYMKGDVAHCGFPEKAWAKNCQALVQAGYRVARIEQTETPAAMSARLNKTSGNVRRELCQIHTPGSQTLTVRDAPIDAHAKVHMLTVVQDPASKAIAVCVLNPTTGTFRLAELPPDDHLVELRSVLAVEQPAELVFGTLHAPARLLLTSQRALCTTPPPVLVTSLDGVYALSDGARAFLASQTPLVAQALFLCVSVLKRCLVDDELVTMGLFQPYPRSATGQSSFLTLDAQALKHLDVLCNSVDGTTKGSLLGFVDHTSSSFGQRLLREWVAHPLYRPEDVRRRQDAVLELMSRLGDFKDVELSLKQSTDLERALNRIHALSTPNKASHPDSRAVVYDAIDFSKAKIETLAQAISSLLSLHQACSRLSKRFSSPYLAELAATLGSDALLRALDELKRQVDFKAARASGFFEPKPGVSAEYDAAEQHVKEIKAELNDFLKAQERALRCSLGFWQTGGSGKERYQIETPEHVAVPKDWSLASKKKGFRRFACAEVKKLVAKLDVAEPQLAQASKDVSRHVFAKFDANKDLWMRTWKAAADLDCLLSLAKISNAGTDAQPMVLPRFVTAPATLELTQARHPCVAQALAVQGKRQFIPNDTVLSPAEGVCLLLTGPNMGGKSTLLRQTCLCVILAHLGCLVPCKQMSLSPVDRIFTRIGASDRILEKQSTFFVELSETATILQCATAHSLIILDELGRGTSTFDGTAIAHAVVDKLTQIGARTLFATHYHSLVREVGLADSVQLGHMACLSSGQDHGQQDDVTFLYKLEKGPSDRSYGLNVARLARIPEAVVNRAQALSLLFERAFFKSQAKGLLAEVARCRDEAGRVALAKRAKVMLEGGGV